MIQELNEDYKRKYQCLREKLGEKGVGGEGDTKQASKPESQLFAIPLCQLHASSNENST